MSSESNNLVYDLIMRLTFRIRQRSFAANAGLPVSAQQGRTLFALAAQQAQGVIQRDIAEQFGARAASVTPLLQELEAKGYIERRVSPADGRRKTLHILPPGEEIIAKYQTAMKAVQADLVAGLTPEEEQILITLLTKIDHHFTGDNAR